MIKKNQRRRSRFANIILLILVLVSFFGYSTYLLIKDYTPNKETLLENIVIVQKEKVTQDESTKEFDEVIKKLEKKRNNPNKQNQLEIEKQAKIAEEKEKLKQKELSQKPLKKEQKMTRYEDWIDEPSESPPVEKLELEKLELEKIQWKEGEGKPDER